MRLERITLVSLVIYAAVCGTVAGAADLESARAAYDRHEYEAAATEFLALAEQGNPEAQLAIAKMYMIGQGVKTDRAQALKWFQAAAERSNADAQFFLGAMYLLPQTDIGEGLKWLRLAADQGMQDAQYLLGKAYMQGSEQLPRDPIQGAMWLSLAARGNREFYQNELRSAQTEMTADQITKAEALGSAWKPAPRPEARQRP